jgi:DNA-binding NtrC family response regulator
MTGEKTGSMGGSRPSAGGAHATDAGLVVLYAPNQHDLPPVLRLRPDATILGREPPEGGIRLPETAVSRIHARIARVDGVWIVTDLDSRNGVLLDGRPVKEAPLRRNDQLRIGDSLLKFVPQEAAAYAELRPDDDDAGLVGGLTMRRLSREIGKVAPTDLSVLVLGETGTGKELVARALHAASGRPGGFFAVNCAAIPGNLVESELFGHKRGAFTGADRDRAGVIRAAHRGTLLLDEIGDMPLEAQAKLLRMLETREIVPLASTTPERVDVRVVCATHRDLQSLVDAGSFRGDLFARINGYALRVVPLRERKEEIVPLVRHFLAKHGRPDAPASLSFMVAVCHYDWPYNVRELEAAVRRAAVVADGTELDESHLPEAVQAAMRGYGKKALPSAPPPSRSSAAASAAGAPTAEALRASLTEHRGNVAAVARAMGRDRTQIHRWMRMHGIKPTDFR